MSWSFLVIPAVFARLTGMQAAATQLKVKVLVVGAGPAGLACAIRLARAGHDPGEILVLEKSAQLGGHLLSGAVMRPQALQQLLTPAEYAALPLGPLVTRDTFHALLPKGAIRVPFVPPKMRMRGLPLVSLSQLGRALGEVAAGLVAAALGWPSCPRRSCVTARRGRAWCSAG